MIECDMFMFKVDILNMFRKGKTVFKHRPPPPGLEGDGGAAKIKTRKLKIINSSSWKKTNKSIIQGNSK